MTRLVFSPHLNTCLEKASTPTDTAAYGNGDRPGGGGETRRLSPGASLSVRGRRAGPAAGVGDTPRPSLPPLRAQPGPPSRLLLSPPLSGLTRDRLGHRHPVRFTCRKSLVCTQGQEAVSLGTREPGGPQAVCLGWAARGGRKALRGPALTSCSRQLSATWEAGLSSRENKGLRH